MPKHLPSLNKLIDSIKALRSSSDTTLPVDKLVLRKAGVKGHQLPLSSSSHRPSSDDAINHSNQGSTEAANKSVDQFINSNLCAYCKVALSDWTRKLGENKDDHFSSVEYPHYQELDDFLAGVEVNGCRICWLFLHSSETQYVGGNHEALNSNYERVLRISPAGQPGVHTGTRWNFELCEIEQISSNLRLNLMEIAESDSDFQGDDENATHALSTDYTSSLQLARTWLNDCSDKHARCGGGRSHTNPTRLLCIKPGDTYLCSGSDLPSGILYATLSHCWGNLKFFQLRKANLSTVYHKINILDLPKTFYDAILIARHLDFEYIWIDSLCIIQDDDADWSRESSLMSSIYSNAHLNIAAAGAVDGSEGCFFERPPPHLWRYRIPLTVRGKKGVYGLSVSDPSYRCVWSQPLVKRAWALQERILARRTIHFSKTELLWECNTKVACETFPEGLPKYQLHPGHFHKKEILDWHIIVDNYTSAKLTYSKDKLVALSGIAQMFHQRTGDQYVAGMWRHDLELSLIWVLQSKTVERPAEERAPTWSWASIDGRVVLAGLTSSREYVKHIYIKVLDIFLQMKTSDPFGELTGGTLKLGCEALLGGIIGKSTTRDVYPVKFGQSTIRLLIVWDCKEYTLQPCGLHIFIPIMLRNAKNFMSFHGIVVQPTRDAHARYSRVASFESLWDKNPVNLKHLIDRFKSSELSDGTEFTEINSGEDQPNRYVIEIV